MEVFEEDRNAHRSDGGITWCEVQFPFVTSENPGELCSLIIYERRFDLFLYPKKTPEPTPTPAQEPYFDEHRFQAACAAMGGLLSNPTTMFDSRDQNIANALAHADALLSALKGGDK